MMSLRSCVLGLLCVSTALAASVPRTSVPFDYGWRHKAFDPAGESPACTSTFSDDLTAKSCSLQGDSFQYTPQGRLVQLDCEKSCCSRADCRAWAFVKSAWEHACYISFVAPNCTESPSDDGNVLAGAARESAPAFPPYFSYVSESFDDSDWTLVDLPHDSVINNTYNEGEDNKHGSLPRNVTWYRKHFNIPADWTDSYITLEFDGVFHLASVWINGLYVHTAHSGYIPLRLHLNPGTLNIGGENVVAVRADPSFGSGHWYEGGGIYRRARLVRKSMLHIDHDDIYANPEGDGKSFTPVVRVSNALTSAQTASAVFTLFDSTAKVVANGTASSASVPGQGTAELTTTLTVPSAQLWSVETPNLYKLEVTIVDAAGETTDVQTVDVGFRSTKWTADNGFYLNGNHLHLHGFCHHEDFAGVGVAVPDRINLYRAMALKAVGGDSWRTSHNPYSPAVYDILNRVGIVVWDEARDYTPWQTADMAAMVKRDRNHPSVVIWSFCNEIECHQDALDNTTQFEFRQAAKTLDPSRPVSYNWVNVATGDKLDEAVDVHGISHYNSDTYISYHHNRSTMPLVSSECCSCQTQRGEVATSPTVFWSDFDGDCLQQQPAWSDNLTYVAGTMGIWTLFDYYGEPQSWPHISSSFGQFDLTGLPKAHAHWYRAWWQCGPLTADSCAVAHIVEPWDAATPVSAVHVFTNAPQVELMLDGETVGKATVVMYGYAAFNVSFTPKTLVAIARDENGVERARHTVEPQGAPSKINLSLDVPSAATGTGTSLVADGHDAAVVRARIVDANGNVVNSANHSITFTVEQGPGRVIGVGNGDPASHEYNQVDTRAAYHGWATAVVQVALDCTSPHREEILAIDADGNQRTSVVSGQCDDTTIVIRADAIGLGFATISVPVSNDVDNHGVLAVAAKAHADKFFDQFE